VPRADTVGVNLRAFAFAAMLSLTCALAVGIPAILRARHPDSSQILPTARGSDARGRRRRATLVAVEVALGTLLLIGAALLGKSFANLRSVRTGVDLEKVVALQLTLPRSTYENSGQVAAFYHALLERLRTISGVTEAAAADTLPLEGSSNRTSFSPRGSTVKEATSTDLIAGYTAVTEGYFETLRIGLRRGRLFDGRDRREGVRSAIVNETLARQFWPAGDAVGRSLILGLGDAEPFAIVGVVADVRHEQITRAAGPHVYVPHAVLPYRTMTVVVRSTVTPASLVPAMRRAVWSLDPGQPASAIRTGEDILAGSLAQARLSLTVVGFFAAIALALALVGLVGVTVYAVVQRTPEIGIRMAMGAAPAAIGRMVVREGMVVVAGGLAAGLGLALIFSQLLSTLLYGVQPVDGATYAEVLLLMAAIACAALYVPARRAARIDPTLALRWE